MSSNHLVLQQRLKLSPVVKRSSFTVPSAVMFKGWLTRSLARSLSNDYITATKAATVTGNATANQVADRPVSCTVGPVTHLSLVGRRCCCSCRLSGLQNTNRIKWRVNLTQTSGSIPRSRTLVSTATSLPGSHHQSKQSLDDRRRNQLIISRAAI